MLNMRPVKDDDSEWLVVGPAPKKREPDVKFVHSIRKDRGAESQVVLRNELADFFRNRESDRFRVEVNRKQPLRFRLVEDVAGRHRWVFTKHTAVAKFGHVPLWPNEAASTTAVIFDTEDEFSAVKLELVLPESLWKSLVRSVTVTSDPKGFLSANPAPVIHTGRVVAPVKADPEPVVVVEEPKVEQPEVAPLPPVGRTDKPLPIEPQKPAPKAEQVQKPEPVKPPPASKPVSVRPETAATASPAPKPVLPPAAPAAQPAKKVAGIAPMLDPKQSTVELPTAAKTAKAPFPARIAHITFTDRDREVMSMFMTGGYHERPAIAKAANTIGSLVEKTVATLNQKIENIGVQIRRNRIGDWYLSDRDHATLTGFISSAK